MASSVKAEPKDDALTVAMGQFEEYADATIASRELAERCRDYRDGNQWTEEERATLKKRKQPCITDNKIQDKCDTLLGIEKQMRTDPKAYPRTPGDEKAAEAATDALRFIADQSDFNRTVRKPAADNLMVEGLCAGHVIVEKKKGRDPKVCMEHVRWDRVYYDIHSLREDFEDKSYCGYFRWMDFDAAKREFPDNADKLEASFGGESASGPDKSHDDKPRYTTFVSKRKRVQVFKHFMLKAGVWHEGVWCKGGWLEAPKPCAYKNEYGEPQCCLEIQALYRDADGNPYGMVQRYLDPQDEHNKRRSKMLHLLNSKRIIAQRGTIDDIQQVRTELHKPDGVIEISGDTTQFRVEDNLSEADAQFKLLQYTDVMLSQIGPNPSLQGVQDNNSGRAKQLEQQAGTLPISPLFDALDGWETRMYRQAWYRVKQYWTSETWVRVTDDQENVRFVGINQPVLQGDLLAEKLAALQIPDAEKAAQVEQIASDPSMQSPVTRDDGSPELRNDVSRIDVDIIIDRSPDVANLQQEEFQVLSELAKSRPEVPFQAIIKASSLRSQVKKEISDQLAKQPQIPPELQKQMEEQQKGLEAAQQELMKKAQEVEATEQTFKDMQSQLSVEAAGLDVQKAEIRAEMAKLDAAKTELQAQQALLDAQANSVKQAAEVEHEKLNASVESARSTLAQEAVGFERDNLSREREGMAKSKEESGAVMEGVVKLIEQQETKFEKALAQMQSQIMQALASSKPAPRRVNIERGTDGKPAALVEE